MQCLCRVSDHVISDFQGLYAMSMNCRVTNHITSDFSGIVCNVYEL